MNPRTINIQPPVSVYATYRRLSYTPWYAIAEFVDNSTQNYFDHKGDLDTAYIKEKTVGLKVDILYDAEANSISIKDNAFGMDIDELARAVMLDKPPVNKFGRSEFGMGLKTASCWFGDTWTISTKRFGSNYKYKICIDVNDLRKNLTENIPVEISTVDSNEHYTILEITNLHKPLRTRTHQRIKDHLSSIYRQDLRSKNTHIFWNGEPLNFEDSPVLVETHEDGSLTSWKKDIEFTVKHEGVDLFVRGWIAIRNPGSQRDAGFVLMRRGRVIRGGPGEGYKPSELFGQGNTFRSQRLIGELHMDNWPVTQAKDMFDWSGGLEDEFIESLKEKCKDYMDQAEGFRERKKPVTKEEMIIASEPMNKIFKSKEFSEAISTEIQLPFIESKEETEKQISQLESVSQGPLDFFLSVRGREWKFKLHWQTQWPDAPWMSIKYPDDHTIEIFLNTAHSFFVEHMDNLESISIIQKFVLALALAEKLARESGDGHGIQPDDLRVYMNHVLRYASQIEQNGTK